MTDRHYASHLDSVRCRVVTTGRGQLSLLRYPVIRVANVLCVLLRVVQIVRWLCVCCLSGCARWTERCAAVDPNRWWCLLGVTASFVVVDLLLSALSGRLSAQRGELASSLDTAVTQRARGSAGSVLRTGQEFNIQSANQRLAATYTRYIATCRSDLIVVTGHVASCTATATLCPSYSPMAPDLP